MLKRFLHRHRSTSAAPAASLRDRARICGIPKHVCSSVICGACLFPVSGYRSVSKQRVPIYPSRSQALESVCDELQMSGLCIYECLFSTGWLPFMLQFRVAHRPLFPIRPPKSPCVCVTNIMMCSTTYSLLYVTEPLQTVQDTWEVEIMHKSGTPASTPLMQSMLPPAPILAPGPLVVSFGGLYRLHRS